MKAKIGIFLGILMGSFSQAQTTQDSLSASRYVMRATLFGTGYTNVYDTYLSPVEYTGPEVRFIHERMRMTHLLKGKISSQNIIQIQGSYTRNISDTGKMYAGLVNWSYALHYQFQINSSLKLLIGPYLDLNAGVIYNRRNSNNPAQAKGYANLGTSGLAIYKFRIKKYPLTLRYQANLPIIGIMFSPEYGESYYEIFSLKNGGKNVLFTSLHNQPSLRQMLTLDFPIKNTILRAAYICDIQQAEINHLRNHTYSHDFMIGFVRNLHWLRGRRQISMPEKVNPF